MSKNRQKNHKWLLYIILGGFIIEIARFFFKKDRFEDIKENIGEFVAEEKKEAEKLKKGRETFKDYCRHSGNIFKDYFVPNECNEFKPKALRTHSLALILIFALLLKAAITGYLFFIFPNEAFMTEQMTKEILELTNADRAINNIGQLTLDPALSAAALAKAEDMLKNEYFSHYSPDGKKPWDWISRAAYPYLLVGENLAMDFSTAKSAHDALMQSPSHRKNILNGTYREVGLAIVTGEFNGHTTNILVETFGSRKDASLAVNTEAVTKTETAPPAANSEGTKVLATENAAKPVQATSSKVATTVKKPVVPKPAIAKPQATTTENIVKATTTGSVIPAATTTDILNMATTSPKDQATEIAAASATPIAAAAKPIMPVYEEPVSPNQELAETPMNKITYIAASADQKTRLASLAVNIGQTVLIILLIVLILALLANIAIEITVQHKPIIIQTLLLIILISGLLSLQLHHLENIATKVALL
jgi:hypothetical protein